MIKTEEAQLSSCLKCLTLQRANAAPKTAMLANMSTDLVCQHTDVQRLWTNVKIESDWLSAKCPGLSNDQIGSNWLFANLSMEVDYLPILSYSLICDLWDPKIADGTSELDPGHDHLRPHERNGFSFEKGSIRNWYCNTSGSNGWIPKHPSRNDQMSPRHHSLKS